MKSEALAILVAATLITTASAQLRPKRYFTLNPNHLTQAIVKALSDRGIETDSTHIALLGNVISSDPSPNFDVRSTHTLSNTTHTTIKLTCRQPATCLPFYVLVDAPAATIKPQQTFTKIAPIVMRTGTSATLLMDDGREHLQISVISMESGPTGRTIRVRTPDYKRVYSAQIVTANTLEAGF